MSLFLSRNESFISREKRKKEKQTHLTRNTFSNVKFNFLFMFFVFEAIKKINCAKAFSLRLRYWLTPIVSKIRIHFFPPIPSPTRSLSVSFYLVFFHLYSAIKSHRIMWRLCNSTFDTKSNRHLRGSATCLSSTRKYFGHCLPSTWIVCSPNSRPTRGTVFHYSKYWTITYERTVNNECAFAYAHFRLRKTIGGEG